MKWITKLPEKVIQNCLITWERKDGSRYVELNAILPNENRNGIAAYMPITHFLDNREGWKSEFIGDDLPSKNGMYLCCKDEKFRRVYMLWFDTKKCTFGGCGEMIAYKEIPFQYTGKKMSLFKFAK